VSGAWWSAAGVLALAPVAAVVALVVVRRSFLGMDAEAAAVRDLRRELAALTSDIEVVRRRVDAGRRAGDG
jgi:hypothetical protein